MKEFILKQVRLIDPARNLDVVTDLAVADGKIAAPEQLKHPEIIAAKGVVAAPGFIDLHVHLRQPGNTGAETIASGTAAAAAGGFTSVVAMPNTNPPADTAGAIEFLRSSVKNSAVVKVLATGCMTKEFKGEEMAPIGALKQAGVVALTDDGRCIQNHGLMRHVMQYAKSFELPILDHCEELSLLDKGVMHEGKWSVLLGMKGMPRMAEDLIVARDIMLAAELDWQIHIQHVSSAESVHMIREAQQRGIKVTAEATPHHFTLTDECIKSFDTHYKMNPPLRSERDRDALLAGLADGTIAAIATDHAPHTETAKNVEFDFAPFGIVGLETAVALAMTQLVHKNVLSLQQMIQKFTTGPAQILRLPEYSLAEGHCADITLLDPEKEFVIDSSTFRSRSRNTPFDNWQCKGKAVGTIVDGEFVFRDF